MHGIILAAVLISTYLMAIAKRMPALIRSFRYQSFCLFLSTFIIALAERRPGLYIIAALIFALKVCLIPYLLYRIIGRIKVKQDIGLFINPQMSLFCALVFTYLSWLVAGYLSAPEGYPKTEMLTAAFFMVSQGMFLMIFRKTALAQIIGLLTMENGLFLLASAVSGGMPFFVEIAVFFDVFMSVLIMGFFVYRINNLFTHIDVHKLSRLKR